MTMIWVDKKEIQVGRVIVMRIMSINNHHDQENDKKIYVDKIFPHQLKLQQRKRDKIDRREKKEALG